MMILRSAAPSPFGRKVRIALAVLGFDDVRVEPADTVDPHDTLRDQNPLGKIPVLIAEDGAAYYDSRVILEYLDCRVGGGKIIPRDVGPRFIALRLQALCDGILDASILTVYEGRWRALKNHEPKWLNHQGEKVGRALAALEAAPRAFDGGGCVPDVGEIALACALGYRDLRFDGDWRALIRVSSRGSTTSPLACRPSPRQRCRFRPGSRPDRKPAPPLVVLTPPKMRLNYH